MSVDAHDILGNVVVDPFEFDLDRQDVSLGGCNRWKLTEIDYLFVFAAGEPLTGGRMGVATAGLFHCVLRCSSSLTKTDVAHEVAPISAINAASKPDPSPGYPLGFETTRQVPSK